MKFWLKVRSCPTVFFELLRDLLGGVLRVETAVELDGCIVEEVESAYLVGAVVRTVACTDASVVRHVVGALVAVNRRVDRADGFTRCVLTMHAGNGLNDHFVWVVEVIADEVAIHADPGHLAALRDLVLADDWDVVLALTRDGARVATHARIQIDRHAPLRALREARRHIVIELVVVNTLLWIGIALRLVLRVFVDADNGWRVAQLAELLSDIEVLVVATVDLVVNSTFLSAYLSTNTCPSHAQWRCGFPWTSGSGLRRLYRCPLPS